MMKARKAALRAMACGATSMLIPGIPALAAESGAAAEASAPTQAQARALPPDDIIVTARRREESNLDVPIAISAFSEDGLQSKGIAQVDDLQRIAPSISFRPNAGRRSNSIYEIRGAAGNDSLITGDPAVGIYVDEVYRARALGTNQSFYDIANVQVLYGPQGTLFGRNSASGAVLINTRRPTDMFEGQVTGGIGNLGRYEVTGVLNVPVSDKLAVRFAGQRVKRDGYGVNVTTGRKLADTNIWSGRFSVAFRPTDTVENVTIASYYRANERGSLVTLYGYRPCPSPTATTPSASCSTRSMPDVPAVDNRTIGQALAEAWARRQTLGNRQTALDAGFQNFPDEGVAASSVDVPDPFEKSRNFSATNITSIELSDDITLKNIFGYNYTRYVAATDLDGTPIDLIDSYYHAQNRLFSEELQLQGDSGALTWVVGGMYFRERGRDIQYSIQNVYSDGRQNLLGINKSIALFAQGTYKLTEQLSLTAGGRYTWDKRRATYIQPITYPLALNTLVRGAGTCGLSPAVDTDGDCILKDTASFKQPTYTFSVDYKPSRNLLFYVAHRLGYRSGGLQARTGLIASGPAVGGVTPVESLPPFKAETVRDIELGFKGDMALGGEARLNTSISAYQAWYKGIQRSVNISTGLTSTTNPVGSPTTTGIINAGKSTVKGFSAEANLTLVRGFRLNGALGYVDGVYKTFRSGTTVFTDIPYTNSKWTANFGIDLTPIDTPETGSLTFSGTYSFRSRFTTANSLPNIDPEAIVPAQHLVNLSINWDEILGSRLSGQLWMRNATNESYPLGVTSLASNFGIVSAVMAEPRTYGMNLTFKF